MEIYNVYDPFAGNLNSLSEYNKQGGNSVRNSDRLYRFECTNVEKQVVI